MKLCDILMIQKGYFANTRFSKIIKESPNAKSFDFFDLDFNFYFLILIFNFNFFILDTTK